MISFDGQSPGEWVNDFRRPLCFNLKSCLTQIYPGKRWRTEFDDQNKKSQGSLKDTLLKRKKDRLHACNDMKTLLPVIELIQQDAEKNFYRGTKRAQPSWNGMLPSIWWVLSCFLLLPYFLFLTLRILGSRMWTRFSPIIDGRPLYFKWTTLQNGRPSAPKIPFPFHSISSNKDFKEKINRRW